MRVCPQAFPYGHFCGFESPPEPWTAYWQWMPGDEDGLGSAEQRMWMAWCRDGLGRP
ncbi:hypothetical protein THAOC_21570, partial [Thalassiosira oceanica]